MPEFAANLDSLWTELHPTDRPAAAARAGFQWVEIPFPYEVNAAELRRELLRRGLRLALMACPPPNYTGGPRGFAGVPGAEGRFRRDFDRAMRYAELLKPRTLHVLAGDATGPEARRTLRENLAWASRRAPGQRLAVSPGRTDALGPIDQAAALLGEVGAANLSLLLDAAWIADADAGPATDAPPVGHVRLRRPPDGEDALLAAARAGGHDGPIGVAYDPAGITEPTLGWFQPAS